jgi:tetratricopeptide (TPR) repeat protein
MKISTSALAIVLAAVAAPAAAQAQPAKPAAAPASAIQPSAKAVKPIMEFQAAVNAKDTASIPAKLAAAQAAAKTKEDHYWIARIQFNAALNANDIPGAMTALGAMQSTGLAPASEVAGLYEGLGGKAFNAKDYANAATAFQRQIALDPNNAKAISNLAIVRAASGNKGDALAALEQAIKAAQAGGTKASEQTYKNAVSMAYEAKSPNASELARQWVTAYPGADSWHNAIAIFRNRSSQDSEGTLSLLRLMQATGAMNTTSDYAMFAGADMDQMNYNEAQAVIDAGIAAKIIDPESDSFKGMVASIKAKKKPTAAELDAALKASPSAFNQLRIGDRFYGMGDYAKAAEIYRKTLGKPGTDPAVVNLHLGMALARAGDKAGAIEAFNAVKGAREDIAKLWLIYVNQAA